MRKVAIPAIVRGRPRIGKSLESFKVVAAVPVAIPPNMEAATALLKEELTRYTRLPFYRAMLVASGFGEELAAFDRDNAKYALPGPAIPNRLAAALGSIGDAHAVRQYVAAYLPAGVTLAAVRPIGFPDAPHYRSTLETLAR